MLKKNILREERANERLGSKNILNIIKKITIQKTSGGKIAARELRPWPPSYASPLA